MALTEQDKLNRVVLYAIGEYAYEMHGDDHETWRLLHDVEVMGLRALGLYRKCIVQISNTDSKSCRVTIELLPYDKEKQHYKDPDLSGYKTGA